MVAKALLGDSVSIAKILTVMVKGSRQAPPPVSIVSAGPRVQKVSKSSLKEQTSLEHLLMVYWMPAVWVYPDGKPGFCR